MLLLTLIGPGVAFAQGPDRPVFTEVYHNPPGNDGPVGRDPGNLHQEFIEIYLPPAADLNTFMQLDKDAISLTLIDVEGDPSAGAEYGSLNYRIDLPVFDLDPSNGLTGLPRPASGIVVLGWVDYLDPPTDLAGTPGTRVALIDGGVSSTSGFTFIALNGAEGSGTTNFPVPVAVSHLDNSMGNTLDPATGMFEAGSGVYILASRTHSDYLQLCAFDDPAACASFADLANGNALKETVALDCFAGNDDPDFDPDDQPYAAPTGLDIDLEFVLPQGGKFSPLCAQVEEDFDGYARLVVDLVKTTEDANLEDDPVADYPSYRSIPTLGPLAPTPGSVHFTTDPAELELGFASLQVFQVLTDTVARPGLLAANAGGDFGMNTVTTPGASSDPAQMVLSAGASSFGPTGQLQIFPEVVVQTFPTTTPGHTQVVTVHVDASVGMVGDPAVVNPSDSVTATFTAINPTTGLDAAGLPFQATSFLAVQGLPDEVGVANEFAGTSLGVVVAANLGGAVKDTRGNGTLLVNPTTDLADPLVVDPLIASLPDDPLFYINATGAPGTDDLVTTVLNSAEVVIGKTSYDESFNLGQTLVQAREFPIAETRTFLGGFTPTELIHYADAKGRPGVPGSGFGDVLTGRDFELAILDTNLGPPVIPPELPFVESGASDDFGLIVEAGVVAPGSPVVTGEFVFLSFTGGLEGADIDTLDVPPRGNLTNIIYLDLEPLHTTLGVQTITRLFVIDGSGGSEIDPIEIFSLALGSPVPALLPVGFGALALSLAAIGGRTLRRSKRDPRARSVSHGLTGSPESETLGRSLRSLDGIDVKRKSATSPRARSSRLA